jgi:HlyD family secretion protein
MKLWIIVIALLVLAGAGIVLWQANSAGQSVEAAVVVSGEIREFVDEQGTTTLPRIHVITMPFEGRLEAISLSAGDAVKAGDPVAQIVPKDVSDEVALARAAVEQLDAQIAENNDVSVEQTALKQSEHFVESMESTVQAAQARKTATAEKLQLAESTLGRIRSIPARATTAEELQRAEVTLVEAQVDYQQSDLIWKSMASIQAATALLPTMIRQQIAKKDLSAAVLEEQKAEAEVRLRQALLREQRSVMRSPVDGIVLERLVENERLLAGGTELLEIGHLEELEVEAEVLSQDAVRIAEGDPVEIYGPALGAAQGEGLAGSVYKVAPEGFAKRSSLGVEQQRVIVTVRLAAEAIQEILERGVRVGYRVRTRIFTDSKSGARLVPRSALFRGADGGWQVYQIEDGTARLTPVEVGLMNDEVVEIAAGVELGGIVILAPENSLADGAKVDPLLRNAY